MVQIAKLTKDDKGHVRALELFIMKEYFEGTLGRKWDDLSQGFVDQLGATHKGSFEHYLASGLSFVAKEDGQIVGFVFAQVVEHMSNLPKAVWVENIGVEAKESGVYDVGRVVSWDNVEWDATALNANIMVEIRTADDNMTWSAWRVVGNGGRLTQAARYLQCRARLSGNKGAAPVIQMIRVHLSPPVEAHPQQVVDNSAAENMRRPTKGVENRRP